MTNKFNYGGQALLEGVLIRGRKGVAIAVRRPDGSMSTTLQSLSSFYTGRWRKIPFARGIIVLVETLVVGIKALLYSASVAMGEEEKTSPSALLWGTAAFSMVLAVSIFFVLPLFVAQYLDPYTSATANNVIEGLFRAALLVGYLKVIGFMPDIRRVFAYHGAEHKLVNAFEDSAPLEVEAAKQYSKAHLRCGTNFLLVVMLIAVLVFALLGRPPLWLRFTYRLVLIPVIAAMGYEFIQLLARHPRNPIARAFALPGLALQGMTTREPDDGQLEVALAALSKALAADGIVQAPEEETATSSP